MTSTQKVGSDKAVASSNEQVASNKKFSLTREERWPLIKLEYDYSIILDSFEGWIADIDEALELIRNKRDVYGLQAELESVVKDVNELIEQMEESLRWCNVERQKELEKEASREAQITSEKRSSHQR